MFVINITCLIVDKLNFIGNYKLKQLETNIQMSIFNLLNVYKEIGIELIVDHNKINDKPVYFEQNKKIDKQKKYHFVFGEEKNAYDISNEAHNLEELELLFKNFNGCTLKKTATNFVKFSGNKKSKILFIDSPPDIEEDRTGIPFVSDKGVLFSRMLNAIDLKKNNAFFVKSIPWRPPGNRHPTMEEIKICRPFILNLIKFIKPKIIVCLGEVPTNQILNLNETIMKIRGKWRSLRHDTFSPLENEISEIYVLPTISISHLLLRSELKKHAWEDMKLLRNRIKEI